MRRLSFLNLGLYPYKLGLLIIALLSFSDFFIPAGSKNKLKPANEKDIATYSQIGGLNICIASKAGLEFKKASSIATSTIVSTIELRHGGAIKAVGKKKLDYQQLYPPTELNVIYSSLRFCPDAVPQDIKDKIKETKEKIEQMSNKR